MNDKKSFFWSRNIGDLPLCVHEKGHPSAIQTLQAHVSAWRQGRLGLKPASGSMQAILQIKTWETIGRRSFCGFRGGTSRVLRQ